VRNEIAKWYLSQSKSRRMYASGSVFFLFGVGELAIFFAGDSLFNRWVTLGTGVILLFWASVVLPHATRLRKGEKRKRAQRY
jgi:hypothetical protein